MPNPPQLILFARYPTPGLAKTRLIPAVGDEGAAAVHRRLTERTLGVLRAAGAPVELQHTGADAAAFRAWLGQGFALAEQAEGDLTARLLAAVRPGPHLFFGADTPDLTIAIVQQAAAALLQHEVVVGPAEDGGYYLIGMARPMPWLFEEMPWSTDQVLPETLRRLAARGIASALLPVLADCDRPEDLARWPDLLPA